MSAQIRAWLTPFPCSSCILILSKDGEWDPFLLDDGTIGFTRWEYVMKFWSPIQMLWSVRPDGTYPRMIYGSDLSRAYAYPLNYAAARQIPGTSKIACIGSAHHNTGAGPLYEFWDISSRARVFPPDVVVIRCTPFSMPVT